MIHIETIAEVTYNCTLTKEDEEKVRKYAKKQGCSLIEAVEELYFNTPNANDSINLYDFSNEVDFSTERIKSVESYLD